jgi:hypothetical protein
MISALKETGLSPAEAALQSAASSGGTPDANPLAALCAWMESCLPGEIPSEEESEVDLMIQLSGMVHSSTSGE